MVQLVVDSGAPSPAEQRKARQPKMAKSNTKPCNCYVHHAELDETGVWAIQVGCGRTCTNRFAPGHDAQTKSVLINAHRANVTLVIRGLLGDVTTITPLADATNRGWEGFLTETPKKTPKSSKAAAVNAEVESWTWTSPEQVEAAKSESPKPRSSRKAA